MSFSMHNRFRSILLAVVFTAVTAPPALAIDPCDPLIADGSALESSRDWIDANCPCPQFDGSVGHRRPNYKRCVRENISLLIEAEVLSKSCKGPLKNMYAISVCGSGDDELSPCIEQSAAGETRCRIRTATQCQEKSGVTCSEHSNCVNAADTSGDLVVDDSDSGVCLPPPFVPGRSVTSDVMETFTVR